MRLTRIDVAALPGIGNPFSLTPQPGINLVVGPNTSGKSSLARAVQGLLWPASSSTARHEILAASFEDHVGACRAARGTDGVLTWSRDGVAAATPRLPDEHLRSRYDLGLVALVEPRGDGRDRAFAAEVRRQMTGGYDLDVTGASLFHFSTLQAGRRLREWRQAQLARSEHERRHRELRERERGLEGWRAELAAAEALARHAEQLRAALAVGEAQAALVVAEERLAAFPPVLAGFRGEDPQALSALRQAAAVADDDVAACARRRNEAQARRDELGPAPRPDATIPAAVETLVEAWSQATGALESAAVVTAGARSQRDDAALKLAGATPGGGDAAGAGPGREALARLARLFVDAEAARARLEAAESLLAERLLAEGGPAAPGPAQVDDTAAAVAALEAWLSLPSPSPWWPLAAGSAGAILVVGALIARAGRAAPLSLAVGAVLLAAGLAGAARAAHARRRRQRHTATARHALAAVGMAEAERAVAVADTGAAAAARDRHNQAAARRELVASWRDRLAGERDRAAARLRELEAEATVLRRECGLGAALDGRGVLHDADAAARLRDAEGTLARATAEQAKRAANEAERAIRVREALAVVGEESPRDASDATAIVRRWQRRLDEQVALDREIALATEQLQEAARRQALAADELSRLRTRLGLAADGAEDDTIVLLRDRHAAWSEAVTTRDHARAALAARTEAVTPEMLAQPHTVLQEQLTAAADAPGRVRDLLQRITALEIELKTAREGRGLEQALALQEQAREKLDEERATARRAALADWLLDDLRRQAAAGLRPAVLEQAAALLRGFTQGRHRLEVSGAAGNDPAFVAVDETTGRRQPLTELSDGTRVQLLLAVRLAFITAMENGECLPLFLDEALTTTDPARFAAVVSALGELARTQERQIFYLTSQPGDVDAWNRALAARGLSPAHVIDLAAARRLAVAATTAQLAPPPPTAITPPEGDDPAARARWHLVIGVPPLTPYDPAGAQHIVWLLADDARLEYRLLTAGTAQVGPLLAAMDDLLDGGVIGDAVAADLRLRALALAAFLAQWRVGRGRPVLPADLDESGAVSPAMRAGVLDLLRQVRGDTRALAARIGEVKRLQDRMAEKLLAHLREAGALDERPVPDRETVLVRVLGDLGRAAPGRTPDPAALRTWVYRWCEAAANTVGDRDV